jgi:hypothetical protein
VSGLSAKRTGGGGLGEPGGSPSTQRAAVLTVSDGVDMGTREDASGDLL